MSVPVMLLFPHNTRKPRVCITVASRSKLNSDVEFYELLSTFLFCFWGSGQCICQSREHVLSLTFTKQTTHTQQKTFKQKTRKKNLQPLVKVL